MRLRKKGRSTGPAEPEAPAPEEAPGDLFAGGPLDDSEVDLEEDPRLAGHIDLGGLVVAPPFEGVDLRLQIDEESGAVIAVLLAGEQGAVELRAFSAARNDDMWAEVRPGIREEAEGYGGTTSERTGAWGTEVLCQVPVQLPDGQAGTQPSRVIGVNGPRWFLRATLLGLPALQPESSQEWEDAIRSVVVRRGHEAMPPGEALPLRLPPEVEAQVRADAEGEPDA